MNLSLRILNIVSLMFLIAFLAYTSATKAQGTQYYVDDDGSNVTGDGSQAKPWKTISYALTQASGPDATINVAAGTYDTVMGGDGWAEVFPIIMKDGVSLVGAGADVTFLDAEQSAAVIKAENIGEGERIAGFTIRNGYWPGSDQGGGFYIFNSSPIIEDNIITNNDAGASGNVFHSGGGIYIKNGSPTIRNNTITDNGSTILTSDCGGGIYVTGVSSAPLIQNNIISNNTVWIGGAGIYIENSSGTSTIEANLIEDNNQASVQWVDEQESAGGIGLNNSPAIVRNNLIVDNIHTGLNLNGFNASGAYVVNNTIVGNTWSGISVYGAASPFIANNLLASNGEFGINEENGNSDPTVSYNLFDNNSDGVYYDEGITPYLTTITLNGLVSEAQDNLEGDPAFVNQANGDYHLTSGSSAINAGDNNVLNLPGVDFDGDSRIIGGVVDIGADEFTNGGEPLAGLTAVNNSPTMLGQTTTLTANVSSGSNPITYTWNFADGQMAFGQVVNHTYSAIDIYSVVVTATNSVNTLTTTTIVTVTGGGSGLSILYLPFINKPPPTELSVHNNTGGSLTFVVRNLITKQEITRCTVPNTQTLPCDHDGDNSHIFPPGTYEVQAFTICGGANPNPIATIAYGSGPQTSTVECQ